MRAIGQRLSLSSWRTNTLCLVRVMLRGPCLFIYLRFNAFKTHSSNALDMQRNLHGPVQVSHISFRAGARRGFLLIGTNDGVTKFTRTNSNCTCAVQSTPHEFPWDADVLIWAIELFRFHKNRFIPSKHYLSMELSASVLMVIYKMRLSYVDWNGLLWLTGLYAN